MSAYVRRSHPDSVAAVLCRAEPRWPRCEPRPKDLAAGLPALFGFCVLALWAATAPDPFGQAEHYWQARRQHLQGGDRDAARLCLRRVLELRPDWNEPRLERALTLVAEGKPAEAEALARAVASGRTGYPRAQLWLAQRLLRRPGRSAGDEDEAEALLLRYVLGGTDRTEGRALLAGLHSARGRPRLARKHLGAMPQGRPEAILALARLDAGAGEGGRSAARAAEAREQFSARSERAPDDKWARLCLAEADLLLGDVDGAEDVVREGLILDRGDKALRQGMATVYAARFDALERRMGVPGGPRAEKVEVLRKGLAYAPDDPGLLSRLRALDAPEVAASGAVAGARLASGNVAWTQGRIAEARAHWEAALRLDPNLALAANNLAWLLAQEGPSELGTALALAQRAIASRPGDARLLATRGHVLFKMGQGALAAIDLKAALAAGVDTPDLRRALDDLGTAAR